MPHPSIKTPFWDKIIGILKYFINIKYKLFLFPVQREFRGRKTGLFKLGKPVRIARAS